MIRRFRWTSIAIAAICAVGFANPVLAQNLAAFHASPETRSATDATATPSIPAKLVNDRTARVAEPSDSDRSARTGRRPVIREFVDGVAQGAMSPFTLTILALQNGIGGAWEQTLGSGSWSYVCGFAVGIAALIALLRQANSFQLERSIG